MKKPLPQFFAHLQSWVGGCGRWWRSRAVVVAGLWLGLALAARAQVNTYTFAASQGSFTPLSGGTVLPGLAADTYLSPAIPLGFSFVFDGATFTQVKASSNGWLSFNTASSRNHTGPLAAAPDAIRPLVAPLLDDLDGNPAGATGTGSYATTGTAPNRVFTFEWLNWEWLWDSNAAGLSFQVKLYEGTNKVEFVYRQEAGAITASPTQGASIGLAGTGSGPGSYLALSDATAAPAASSTTENTTIFTKPASGQVYSFTPAVVVGCPQPRNLSVATLTNTTATVAWTATGGGTFSIQYGPAGFVPGSSGAATVTSANSTVTLTGLLPSTTYDFYVTQLCGGTVGNSPSSAVGTFKTRAVAPPGNDECAGALVLLPTPGATCISPTSGSVEGATGPGGLPAPVGSADDDVWYSFTATAPAHTVTLVGSGDYVQEVLSGTCASLTAVDYADPNEKLYTGLTVGSIYYVRVYSYAATAPSAAAAAFTICITSPGTPANDECSRAVALTPAVSGAACAAGTPGTLENTTGPGGLPAPVGSADDDVWYSFTATASAHTVTLVGSGDYVQEVLSGTCAGLSSTGFAHAPAKLYTGLSVGRTYYVRVYSFGSTALVGEGAAFTICVTTPPPPANDACANAVALMPAAQAAPCAAATSGSVEGATGPGGLPAPVGSADDDVWYSFTATAPTHTVTLVGSGDYVQEVLSGTCAGLSSTGFAHAPAKLYTGLTVGRTYYVRVYSYEAATPTPAAAAFSICVTTPLQIAPPANDECAGAVALTPADSGAGCAAATTGTLAGATGPGGLPAPVGSADDDVWYSFTATASAHTVTLVGSGDYVQEVLSGTCASLTAVDYADPNEKLYTGLTVGRTYYVRVYSYAATAPSAAAAAFTICVMTPLINDEPCGAVPIPVAAGCVAPTAGTNVGATTTTPVGYPNPGCGTAGSPLDVWFTFTTPASGAGSTAASVITTGAAAGQVRVFSAASCAGPFTAVGCKAGAGGAGTLDLTNLTPSTTYYVLVSGYGPTDAPGAFGICVTPPATCAAPVGLAATGVTATTATLSWSVPSGMGPFTLEYGPAGFAPGSAAGTLVNTAATSAGLANLSAGTTYQFYVTQNCGGGSGSSIRTGPASFSTRAPAPGNDECATATEVVAQFGGSCSTRLVATNVGATGSVNVPAPLCSNYAGGDVWFKVVVPSTGNIIATTDSVAGSAIEDTGLVVYTGTCGALTIIGCDDDSGPGSFSQLELNGRKPGEVLYIRVFEYGNDVVGRFKLCVRSKPLCPVPVGLDATNVAVTSARLAWAVTSAVPGATFTVEYGPQGFTPGSAAGTRLTGLTGTFVDVAGLTANKEYCYYVSQNCGTTGATAGLSAPAGPLCFTTLAPEPANNDACGALPLPIATAACTPVGGNNTGATTSGASGYVNPGCSTSNSPKDVWFTMTTSATAAGVQITTTGGPAGQVRIFTAASCSTAFTQVACQASAGNNQTVGSFDVALEPNTTYYVMVAGYGSNDATGAFTICARQTILSSAKELPGGEVSVFPNPSNTGTITLRVRGAEQARTVQATLLNALGQQVLTQALAGRAGTVEAPLSVQGLAPGIYTLRVRVNDYTITRKVVLE